MALPTRFSSRRVARRPPAPVWGWIGCWAWACTFIIAAAPGRGAEGEASPPRATESEQAALDARIQKLIAQLGDAQYATRERAQSELRRLGLTAFDALYEAQNHEDIEISLRAQFLVRSLTVDWAHEDDPIEVKRLLRGYSDKKEKQRETLMDSLARLPDWAGVEALARLVRFERSPLLSKHAALLVMSQPFPDETARRERLAERIETTMALSKRPAALWMRTYARTLRDPADGLAAWDHLIAEEQRILEAFPGKTSRQLVLDLLRWQAEQQLRLGRRSEAEETMRQAVALVQSAREQILEMVDWLMAHEAWTLVDEIAARYRALFDRDAILLYRLAESQVKQGQRQQGEETARRAFEIANENMLDRIESGLRLQQGRGLIDWAEREFRYVIDKETLVSPHSLRARWRLAEMLHDQGRDREAAQVYRPLVEAMDKDANVERSVLQVRPDYPDGFRSRMYYFLAEQARADGNPQEQRAHLEKALRYDPTEADALIAIYQASAGDEAYRSQARRLVETAAAQFREAVHQQRQYVERVANNEAARETAEQNLATLNNQYAWLVGNTFGDLHQALQWSHDSLKLSPNNGAFLDTLAHCYYALGDYENAVKYQTQAVKQEPHLAQIARKLELFKQAWEAAKKPSSK